jgi:peptide subunit release factor 1 (eRF1)
LYDDIYKDTKNICFGFDEVIKCLEDNFIEKIIIYENYDRMYKDEEFIDWLIYTSKNDYDIKVVILECCTSEGKMFIDGFSGIVGITRYEINSNYLINDDNENFI